MLFAAVYLALLGVCIAFNLHGRRAAALMRPRHDCGSTRLAPALERTARSYAARARLTDHRQWSWGAAAGGTAYGAPVLGAVFVMLDLSRLAVEAPHAPAPALALEPQGMEFLDSPWLSAPASLDLAAAAPLDDHGLAWSGIGQPLQPVHTDAGWFV